MRKIMLDDRFLLTKAVLDGRKTQARLIIPQKELDKIGLFQEEYYNATLDKLEGIELLTHYFFAERRGKLPYDTGEVVAVAQSYRNCGGANEYGVPMWKIISQKVDGANAGWNNKRFVRGDLMPHQIRITDVRIERLQDISDECCLKEGVIKWHAGQKDIPFFSYPNSAKCDYNTPQEAFASLINKVNRKDVWSLNPYMFVYDFALVK